MHTYTPLAVWHGAPPPPFPFQPQTHPAAIFISLCFVFICDLVETKISDCFVLMRCQLTAYSASQPYQYSLVPGDPIDAEQNAQ